jgi:hypothetical protein
MIFSKGVFSKLREPRMKKLYIFSIILAVGLGLSFFIIALAGSSVNEVWVIAAAPIELGEASVARYQIAPDGAGEQAKCNADKTSPVTLTIHTPPGVLANPGYLTFDACNAIREVQFSAAEAGSYAITVSAADAGQGSYRTHHAAFTLLVGAPQADSEAALVAQSAIFSSGEAKAGSLPPEQASFTEEAESRLIAFKSQLPLPNENGWNNTAVTVTWSCADQGEETQSVTTEGADQSASGVCVGAGNASGDTAVVGGINIDKTAPTILWQGEIESEMGFYYGFTPAVPTCQAVDDLSGPAKCNVDGYSDEVGTHILTATAYDLAGNITAEIRPYTIHPWTVKGFGQPVDMNGVVNTVKAGLTVPMKFEIFVGETELTDVSMVDYVDIVDVNCATLANFLEDAVEVTSTSGTSLRYDEVTGEFILNWETKDEPGACVQLAVLANDGSSLTAYFRLK